MDGKGETAVETGETGAVNDVLVNGADVLESNDIVAQHEHKNADQVNDDDDDDADDEPLNKLQGPMNWRKTLRHIKSPAQQEIKETADRDQAAAVAPASPIHWDEARQQLESGDGDQVSEVGSSTDLNTEVNDQAAMVGAASAVKDRRMQHGPRRDDKLRKNASIERRPSNKSLYGTGIPRRRPISPRDSTSSTSTESAFTRQVVRDPNNRPGVTIVRRRSGSIPAPKITVTTTAEKRPPSLVGGLSKRTSSPSNPQDQPAPGSMQQRKVDKVRRARLYLLQQTGPNSFMIGGDGPDHKFRVIIGPQTCSCGRGPHCGHLLFVMLRVFQVPDNDPLLWSKTLKNYEVETLFRNFHARRSSRIQDLKKGRKRAPEPATPEDEEPKEIEELNAATENAAEPVEEDTCPICLLEMVEGESVVECTSCQNKLHHHCISIWFAECKRQNEQLICPLCRAQWSTKEESSKPEGSGSNIEPPEVPPNTRASSPQGIPQGTDILLPHSEPIPPELRNQAAPWVQVLGEELVSCLLSRNWNARETALRHLSRVAIGALLPGVGEGRPGVQLSTDRQEVAHRMLESCLDILAYMCADPVYKVFVAALRTLRMVLGYTPCRDESQQVRLQGLIKPFINAILLKCSDGNRRTSQLSQSTLLELCKGQQGELAVGREIVNPGSGGLGGVNFLLSCVVQLYDREQVTWQWLLGRLYILDKMLDEFPNEFIVKASNTDSEGIKSLPIYQRAMDVLTFALNAIEYPHARVGKLGRRVLFVCGRLQSHSTTVFYEVIKLLDKLTTSMQARMKRRLVNVREEIRYTRQETTVIQDIETEIVPVIENQELVAPCSTPAYHSDAETQGSMSPPSSPLPEHLETDSAPEANAVPPEVPPNSPEHKDTAASSSINDCAAHTIVPPNSPQQPTQESSDTSSCANSDKTGTGPHQAQASTSNSETSSKHNMKIREDSVKLPRTLALPNSPRKVDNNNSFESCVVNANSPRKLESIYQQVPLHDVAEAPIGFVMESPYDKLPEDESDLCDKSSEDSLDILSQDSPVSTCKATCSSSAGALTGDFSDCLMSPSTPDDKLVSFRTEVTSHLMQSPNLDGHKAEVQSSECPCKEEVEKEEAQALAKALEESEKQTSLPLVPGLSSTNENDTFTIHVQDEDGNQTASYVEGLHWERGPVLGTGAFSTCYQARDVKAGILMAVKQISYCRNSMSEQDKVIEAVRDEIKVMSRLNHPNIVRIIGATQQGCHFFLFTEWMPGGSVAYLLERYGPFSESVIVNYTQQILRAIAHLHDNHVLHRDLKGANLLIDSTGQRVRIADFGAAARLASKTTGAGEFQGQLLGTIAFMAPEVLRGDNYGRKCDIWSIGCVMIEMATSKPPWGASDVSNHLALIFKIASSISCPPIPENLSPAVRDLMLRCLEVDRSDRPPAKELLKHPLFTMYRKS